jgi:hypothetical protein
VCAIPESQLGLFLNIDQFSGAITRRPVGEALIVLFQTSSRIFADADVKAMGLRTPKHIDGIRLT